MAAPPENRTAAPEGTGSGGIRVGSQLSQDVAEQDYQTPAPGATVDTRDRLAAYIVDAHLVVVAVAFVEPRL